eukprot:177439-Rhodomonas_salina.1
MRSSDAASAVSSAALSSCFSRRKLLMMRSCCWKRAVRSRSAVRRTLAVSLASCSASTLYSASGIEFVCMSSN